MSDERQQQIGAVYIPAPIMCEDTITMTQKVIWGRIQGLSVKEGYCYASNNWIGEQIGLSKGTISNNISVLVTMGYLAREIIRDDNNEIKERRLYPINPHVPTRKAIPVNDKIDTPINVSVEGGVTGSSLGVEKKIPSEKPKMSGDDLTRLTEAYAELRGSRPRGKAWLPIQQGIRAMVVEEGYTPDQVEECMKRIAVNGWVWTINTVRRWIADYVAGTMPDGFKEPSQKHDVGMVVQSRGAGVYAHLGGRP